MSPIRVERLSRDLEELAQFGADPSGGTNRACFSPAYRQAVDWVAGRMREAGMSVRSDAAGNLIGRLGPTDAPAVICGSHIDGVPGGGRFDGALGVLAGVECARVLAERATPESRALEVVAFADEEGAYLSLLGSRAMTGTLPPAEIAASVGRDGTRLTDVMRTYGLDPVRIGEATRSRGEVAAYVELHIEQGPILEAEDVDIGVVTDVVGVQTSEWRITGEACHSGAARVGRRSDALRAAAEIVTHAYATLERDFGVDRHSLNFGAVEAAPSASNVVPGSVRLQQEIRSSDDHAIDAVYDAICEIARDVALARNVDVESRVLCRDSPAPMSESILGRIECSCLEAGVQAMRLSSTAGHDAQVMARFCDAGMIFIPSRSGISHHPSEYSSIEQIGIGATVLHSVLRALLSGGIDE